MEVACFKSENLIRKREILIDGCLEKRTKRH